MILFQLEGGRCQQDLLVGGALHQHTEFREAKYTSSLKTNREKEKLRVVEPVEQVRLVPQSVLVGELLRAPYLRNPLGVSGRTMFIQQGRVVSHRTLHGAIAPSLLKDCRKVEVGY